MLEKYVKRGHSQVSSFHRECKLILPRQINALKLFTHLYGIALGETSL